MSKITYTDKVYLNENVDIPAINKVRDVDMNEIKSVVNDNADIVQDIIDAEVYSTSEVKTNKVWIDGKPIYRKVFTGTLASAINHGLTNVNFVNAYGFYISSSGTFLPLASLRPNNSTFNTGFYVTSTQIIFDKGTGSTGNCYITLEYIKTTD